MGEEGGKLKKNSLHSVRFDNREIWILMRCY